MSKIWITYAWQDNEDQDVDYISQELTNKGLETKLDRWNIGAGRRLWDQIERFICSTEESDAWLLIATQNSLSSEPCKEEYAYALDRALSSRGQEFPVIALFISEVDETLIPAGIKTRLFVSITDPDWKERIVAAAEGRSHNITRPVVNPFYFHIHNVTKGDKLFAIEVRPRAGVWAPFFAGIPFEEKEVVNPSIMVGPCGVPTSRGMLINCNSCPTEDNNFWVMYAGNQSTPTQSYYVYCKKLPTKLAFGVKNGKPQFFVEINNNNQISSV